jgi:hypothetical protein
MPDLVGLTERQITYLACALDAALFVARRNEGVPGEELRQLTARIALAVPSAADKLQGQGEATRRRYRVHAPMVTVRVPGRSQRTPEVRAEAGRHRG